MLKIFSFAATISLFLFPSLSNACFTPVGQGPVRAYSQCGPADGAIILYINGTQSDNQSAYPPNPATIDKMIYTLPQGTNTCMTRCLGPGGWYTKDTGSVYTDRSSTSTANTSFVQGSCGTIKASGTATFSDYPAGWTFGTVKLYIDGVDSTYSKVCNTKTCDFMWDKINVTEGPHLLEVKTADSLSGGGTITSSAQFNGLWPVEVTVNSPVGIVNKCNRINVDYKFCYSYQDAKGYANIYFDNNGTAYSRNTCYTESCNIDIAMPDLVGGAHTLFATGQSVTGNKYYNDDGNGTGTLGMPFTKDEIPMIFIEPDYGTDFVPELANSCQNWRIGDNRLGLQLGDDIYVAYDSFDQFATKSSTCPAATYKEQFGQGWSHNYGRGLFKNPNGSMVLKGGGIRPRTYQYIGGIYQASAEDSSTLTKNANSTYTVSYRDGGKENFSSAGALTSVVDRYNNTTTVAAITSHVQTVTDPTGKMTTYNYDTTDTTISSIVDANGNTYNFTYNTTGTLASIVSPPPTTGAPQPVWQFQYDAGNQLSKITDPEGNVTNYSNNENNKIGSITDPEGFIKTFVYGAGTTTVTDKNGGAWKYDFNPATRLVSARTDPLGNKVDFTYGTNNKIATVSRPVEKPDAFHETKYVTAYLYDTYKNVTDESGYPSGKLWKKIKDTGSDVIATYSYDAQGKIVGVSYLDGGWETYTYYANGNLMTAINQNIGYTFEWYKNGWLKKVTDSNGRTVDYNLYDGIGQRRTVTLLAGTADQKVLSYTYGTSGSSNGKLVSIAEAGVGIFGFGYDDMGRRNSLTYPNGVVGTYSYHAEQPGWLAGITYQGTLPITAVSYPSFDKTGNRTSKNIDGSVFTYGYDLVYRLLTVTGAGTESFTFDDAGNRLTEAGQMYTVAAGNVLTAKPGKVYGYDYYGNRTSDGEWVYSWNSKGELIQMAKAGVTVTFSYDPFGRRVNKTAVVGGTSTVHQYVYDAEDIVLEYVDGVLTSHFVHGPRIDEPLALVRSGGVGSDNYFYHADGLGSVVKITDSSQNVVESYIYDSFGRTTAVGTLDQPYEYTGRESDPETGKLYYRLRYYDADSGRFLSRDPLSFAAGDVVLTNYVGGNPVNYVDPWGNIANVFTVIKFNYSRNNYNTGIPSTIDKVPSSWNRLDADESRWHRQGENGKYNVKYIDPTGHKEAVYDSRTGKLVTDCANMGTYNYYSPRKDKVKHIIFDVLPYMAFGNNPDDFPNVERFNPWVGK